MPDLRLLGLLTRAAARFVAPIATSPHDHDGMTATPSVTSKIIISGGIGQWEQRHRHSHRHPHGD